VPRDISGNYTLPVGNPVVTATIIDSTWANTTLSDVATQLNGVMTRDGVLAPTGPIKFTDGTAGTPSISFASAASTGFYRSGTTVGLSVAGTSIMTVASPGAVAVASSSSSLALGDSGSGQYALLATNSLYLRNTSPYLLLRDTSSGTVDHNLSVGSLISSSFSHLQFTGTTRRNLLELDLIKTTAMTIAQLPTASTVPGTRAMVSDASNGIFRAVVVGGGATIVPVHSDGTNWVIG